MIQFQFMDLGRAIFELRDGQDGMSTDDIDACEKLISWLEELAAHRATIAAVAAAMDKADLSEIKAVVNDSGDFYF